MEASARAPPPLVVGTEAPLFLLPPLLLPADEAMGSNILRPELLLTLLLCQKEEEEILVVTVGFSTPDDDGLLLIMPPERRSPAELLGCIAPTGWGIRGVERLYPGVQVKVRRGRCGEKGWVNNAKRLDRARWEMAISTNIISSSLYTL